MLRQGEQFGAPPPLPASAPVAELAAGVQSLLRIFASHGYALDVHALGFKLDCFICVSNASAARPSKACGMRQRLPSSLQVHANISTSSQHQTTAPCGTSGRKAGHAGAGEQCDAPARSCA